MASSLLLNPVSGAPFSELLPSSPTFDVGAGQLVRLDPNALPPGQTYTALAPTPGYAGASFAVLDVSGGAALRHVLIDGNGATIDGAPSVALDTARALGVFAWVGSEWRRVGAPPFLLQDAGGAIVAFNRFDPPPSSVVDLIARGSAGSDAYADAVAAAAQAAAIATSSADATTKANAAQAAAIATSSADATTKANAAQAAATTADRVQIAGIAQAVGTALTAGNFTTSTRFFVDRTGITLTGVRFWWPGGAARTIKASVWDAAGTRLASGTVGVSAAGFYSVTGLAVALPIGVIYRVSLWDNSGISYVKTTSALANAMVPSRAFHAGAGLYYEAITYFAAGDAFPNSTGAEAYLMDPLVSP